MIYPQNGLVRIHLFSWWHKMHHNWEIVTVNHEVLTCVWYVQSGIKWTYWIWYIFQGKGFSEIWSIYLSFVCEWLFLGFRWIPCSFTWINEFQGQNQQNWHVMVSKFRFVTDADNSYVVKSIFYAGKSTIYSSTNK